MEKDKVIYSKLIRVYESGKVEDVDVIERNGIFVSSDGIEYTINISDGLVNNSIKQAIYVTRVFIEEYIKLDNKDVLFDYSIANTVFNKAVKIAESYFKVNQTTIRDKVTVRLKINTRQYIKLVQQVITSKDMEVLGGMFISNLCYKGKNSIDFAQKEIVEIEEMLRLAQ